MRKIRLIEWDFVHKSDPYFFAWHPKRLFVRGSVSPEVQALYHVDTKIAPLRETSPRRYLLSFQRPGSGAGLRVSTHLGSLPVFFAASTQVFSSRAMQWASRAPLASELPASTEIRRPAAGDR